MTEETTDNTKQPVAPEPESEAPKTPGEKHTLKEDIREGAAKAFGLVVEAGSLLGGESGDLVSAERDVAAAEAEELLDRIDGEG